MGVANWQKATCAFVNKVTSVGALSGNVKSVAMMDLPIKPTIESTEVAPNEADRKVRVANVKQRENEMTDNVVWSIGFKEVAWYTVDASLLDGDPRTVEYIDTTPDKGINVLFEPGKL